MNIGQLYQLYSLYENKGSSGNYGIYNGYGNYGTYSGYGNYGLVGSSFGQVLQEVSSAGGSVSGGMETPMDEIFEKATRETGVDIRLLKAVGKAESGFRASATSRCGAMGVMQLMPGTAKSLGVTNAYDPEQNIMGGARYLAKLLDKYDGDVKLALAAYNAGSGNVSKYGGIPPFKETQNYVKKVLEYAGEDFKSGRANGLVQSPGGESSLGGVAQGLGYEGFLDGVTQNFEYADLCKMMVQLMQLEMQQKLQGILGDDSDYNGSGGIL